MTTVNLTQIDRHFEWAKKELENNQNIFLKKKSAVVNELADRLAKDGIKIYSISAMIVKRLKGYVSEGYVTQTLPPEYKSPSHSQKGKAGKKKSQDILAKQTKTLPPLESEESKIIWQMKPEQYAIKEVENYDRPYLVNLVRFLDKKQQPEKEAIKEKAYNLKPEEYKVEDLAKYDKAYLIRIIKWYDNNSEKRIATAREFDERYRKLAQENTELKTQIAQIKKEAKQ